MKPHAAAALLLAACTTMPDPAPIAVTSRWFGVQRDGRPAMLWTLRTRGLEADVTDYGATLVALRMPDRAGFLGDVVLGFDDVQGYQSDDNQYFGCTTGRVCNRIAGASFDLDGYSYVLARNNGPHHLHGGGPRSFDAVHWHGEVVQDGSAHGVRFAYRSLDGEEGYPGNLDVTVTYWLEPSMPPRLRIEYTAQSDRRTPINLTNHAYWNLGGAGAHTVLDHTLQIEADHYTPTDDTLIPTGAIETVAGTPLDFTQPTALGLRIEALTGTAARGYDHNLVLRGSGLRQVAKLAHKPTGRWLTVATTEPGLQLYSGNFLRGQLGKRGGRHAQSQSQPSQAQPSQAQQSYAQQRYAQHSGVCLETQHFPDSVHHAHFPTTILEPGARFTSTTVFQFGVD